MDIFDGIDDKWHFFKLCLPFALNQHAPLKKVVSRCSKKPTFWLTDQLLKAIKEKQCAKHHVSKTHYPNDISVYKKLKNKLKSSIHEAKLHYLQSLLENSKCDPHSFHDLW